MRVVLFLLATVFVGWVIGATASNVLDAFFHPPYCADMEPGYLGWCE